MGDQRPRDYRGQGHEGVVFDRVAEVGDERGPLVIGQVQRHNPIDIGPLVQ